MFKRWESFLLWSTPSSYWIEPTTEKSHILNVSRLGDGRVQVQEYSKQTVPSSATRRTIHGLLGIVDLPLGPVMIVVTRKQKVGDIAGQVIWRVENADVLSLGRRTPASSAELDGHVKCISLILDVLSTPYFYFSYNGDVSNTQQRLSEQNANTGKARTGEESWRRLDRRFIWNFNILQPIHSSSTADQVYKFTLPIIHGAVFIHRCSINSVSFDSHGKTVLIKTARFSRNLLFGDLSVDDRDCEREHGSSSGARTSRATLATLSRRSRLSTSRTTSPPTFRQGDQCRSSGNRRQTSSICQSRRWRDATTTTRQSCRLTLASRRPSTVSRSWSTWSTRPSTRASLSACSAI